MLGAGRPDAAAAMRLSGLLGRPVSGPGGVTLGRVADVAVSLAPPYPEATALLIRRGRAVRRAPWASVAALGPGRVELLAPPEPDGARREGELLLARHVLDAQIVDVAGRRVVRVGDIELAGHDRTLRVVAVDASLAAVLRRLGLGRLARAGATEAIDWRDIHLASGPGHDVQLGSPASAVHRLGPHDLAAVVAGLPPARAQALLERVGPERAAAAQAVTRPRRHRFPHRRRRRAAA